MVFPDIGNGDACRTCGQQHAIWQNKAYAGLDMNISSNYTRHSMLIGTTMTSFAREASNTLHADGLQVSMSASGLGGTTHMMSTHCFQCFDVHKLMLHHHICDA